MDPLKTSFFRCTKQPSRLLPATARTVHFRMHAEQWQLYEYEESLGERQRFTANRIGWIRPLALVPLISSHLENLIPI